MDWVDRPKNYKDLYEILQLLQGSHLDNFPQKTLKPGRVAFHSLTFQFKCLDFQSNQNNKLAPVPPRFCNGLWRVVTKNQLLFDTQNRPAIALFNMHVPSSEIQSLLWKVCFVKPFRETMRNALQVLLSVNPLHHRFEDERLRRCSEVI